MISPSTTSYARSRRRDILENIATACSPCNTRKDKRLVKPKRKPFEPTVHQLMAAQRHFPPNFLHETWRDYLYWMSSSRNKTAAVSTAVDHTT